MWWYNDGDTGAVDNINNNNNNSSSSNDNNNNNSSNITNDDDDNNNNNNDSNDDDDGAVPEFYFTTYSLRLNCTHALEIASKSRAARGTRISRATN